MNRLNGLLVGLFVVAVVAMLTADILRGPPPIRSRPGPGLHAQPVAFAPRALDLGAGIVRSTTARIRVQPLRYDDGIDRACAGTWSLNGDWLITHGRAGNSLVLARLEREPEWRLRMVHEFAERPGQAYVASAVSADGSQVLTASRDSATAYVQLQLHEMAGERRTWLLARAPCNGCEVCVFHYGDTPLALIGAGLREWRSDAPDAAPALIDTVDLWHPAGAIQLSPDGCWRLSRGWLYELASDQRACRTSMPRVAWSPAGKAIAEFAPYEGCEVVASRLEPGRPLGAATDRVRVTTRVRGVAVNDAGHIAAIACDAWAGDEAAAVLVRDVHHGWCVSAPMDPDAMRVCPQAAGDAAGVMVHTAGGWQVLTTGAP
ncbi:MAG: hypothetical protein AB7K09_14270 [Planctomycetota bacterium]